MAYVDENLNDPTKYFEALIWTGDGTSPRTLSGLEFQPDMVWSKRRDDAAGHNLLDSTRGAGENAELCPSSTGIAGSNQAETYGYLSAFTSDGFTVTEGSSDNAYWNNNTATYVSWNWKAGTTSGITTTGSTITLIGYSFSQTSGFSIVRYHGNETAGAKIPHGLAQKPAMIILKNLNNTEQWCVYHHRNTSAPATDYLLLDSTTATADTDVVWNDTEPDTVNVTLGGNDIVNKNGEDLIGYIFAEKQGYSKFGSYVGNNNANGPFLYCGFKPSFFLVKKTDGTDSWTMLDNKRSPFNPVDDQLYANGSDAEADADVLDFVSNGIKIRGNGGSYNGSGNNYIFMAFAEAPFVNSEGVPCNAK